MSKVLVDIEDEDTVIVHIERRYLGLAFDEHEETYEDRGLTIGICRTLELSLDRDLAQQLREALNNEEV